MHARGLPSFLANNTWIGMKSIADSSAITRTSE